MAVVRAEAQNDGPREPCRQCILQPGLKYLSSEPAPDPTRPQASFSSFLGTGSASSKNGKKRRY